MLNINEQSYDSLLVHLQNKQPTLVLLLIIYRGMLVVDMEVEE